VKNNFINEIKKKKIETVSYNDELDVLSYIDSTLLLVELRDSLSEKENTILTLLLQGKTPQEISETMDKSLSQIYKIMNNIKRKIKS
jgi:DNA-binding CsgD family transcriptional regulator